MMTSRPLWLAMSLFVALLDPLLGISLAQESDSQSLIDFSRDIEPILVKNCLDCHGPEDAKNDFRVDELETLLSYVEPGDLESSSLWADYLVTDDEDMLMPPPDSATLTGAELATIKLWIEEGAVASEFAAEPAAAEAAEPVTGSVAERIWIFQGLFHPASVHFPIALLSVSAFFCLLSFVRKESFEAAAFHCLWIGALGAVGASIMGWGYAQSEGYGAGYSFDLNNSAIDRHRWLGIAVAVGSLLLLFVARAVRLRGDMGMRFFWLLGSICLLLGVSITGYQGGELTYGEDHYMEEFSRLFPETVNDSEMSGNGESADGLDELDVGPGGGGSLDAIAPTTAEDDTAGGDRPAMEDEPSP